MRRFAVLVAVLSIVGPAPAFAQDFYRPLLIEPDVYGVPVDALPTPFSNGGSCVAACPNDYAPCDPDTWKHADQRCNENNK